jgi:hypothetical protein
MIAPIAAAFLQYTETIALKTQRFKAVFQALPG